MAKPSKNLIEMLEELRCAIEHLEPSREQRKVRSAFNKVARKSNSVLKKSFDLTGAVGPSCGPLPTPIRPV